MKKTILVILMAVMVATPCIAQDGEPESLFSVDGTLWGSCFAAMVLRELIPVIKIDCGQEFGFYQGTVYGCKDNNCTDVGAFRFYNSIFLSLVSGANNFFGDWAEGRIYAISAIMSPFGVGAFSFLEIYFGFNPLGNFSSGISGCGIGFMYKIDNNWTPPEVKSGS